MAKQIVAPKSQVQSESLVRVDQKDFGRMMADPPASEIGENVAYNENMILSKEYGEGRTGSIEWSDTDLPALRTGITAYRIGNVVTKIAGDDFIVDDMMGCYIVWPDGEHDEIIGYTSATEVITRQSGDRHPTAGCWIRSRVFGSYFHAMQRKIVIHIDTRLFVTDYLVGTYLEIKGICYESPARNKSYFYEDDDYLYCINQSGKFKLNINVTEPYYWKVNSPVMETKIMGVAQSERRPYGRRYIASALLMIGGTYHGSRTGEDSDTNVPLLTILQETGTTKVDQNFIDYGEVFTEKMVGKGNEKYGKLTCDLAGVGLNTNITAWNTLTAWSFGLEINGEGVQQIAGDYSMAFTTEDIRMITEAAIQQYWPTATVELELMRTGLARFIISAGKQDGYTVSYLTAGTSGTDISNFDAVSGCGLYGAAGDAELSNVEQYTEFSIVGDLVAPSLTNVTPTEAQRHFTHFGVHGCKDSGPNGTDVLTGQGNNPEQFMHIDDVPIMKAFTMSAIGYGSPNSRLRCHTGLFSQHDPGNTILFEDGSTVVVEYLCDRHGVRVYTPTSVYAIGDGASDISSQSAVMGSATVLTCSKAEYTVTRVSGMRSFAVTDVRKPLFWADGTVDWITEFVDVDTVKTLQSSDKDSQGVAIDPTSRKFCDTTTDIILTAKIKGFTTNYRFWTALPDCDLGVVVQGFLAVAMRGENTVHYSPMSTAQKYLVGYYNAGYEKYSEIEDEIQALLCLPDKLVVICAQSTWVVATNTPREATVPSVGVTVPLLPMFTMVDEIGCTATGSIRQLGIGLYSMITSEPAHRLFDGFRFGDNLASDQVMDVLKSINTFTYSQYDEVSGLKMWGAKEQ